MAQGGCAHQRCCVCGVCVCVGVYVLTHTHMPLINPIELSFCHFPFSTNVLCAGPEQVTSLRRPKCQQRSQ
jgi:hypothetical protein